MTRSGLAALAVLLALAAAAPAAAATDAALLRRHAPCSCSTRASRAAWWSPAEQSSPRGPRFQPDGRWHAPAAFAAGARSCASGPPGQPWWAFAGLAAVVALALAAGLRRRAARAC